MVVRLIEATAILQRRNVVDLCCGRLLAGLGALAAVRLPLELGGPELAPSGIAALWFPVRVRLLPALARQRRAHALLSRFCRLKRILGTLKCVLKDAQRRGLVAQNVAAETTIGAAKRHQKRIEAGVDFPLPGEVRALLEAAGPKAKALIAVAGLAGLRPSELRALRWSDVQLGKRPAVTVAQRADRWAKVGSPKSATSRRTVPLGETAVRSLKEWRLAQSHGRVLVFGTSSEKPDMLGNLQKRLLTPLCAAAGRPRYSWHRLRHYAISAWLAASIDPKTVQTWAGHKR